MVARMEKPVEVQVVVDATVSYVRICNELMDKVEGQDENLFDLLAVAEQMDRETTKRR